MQTSSDTMQIRYCALALGVLFLLIGLAGFVPGFVSTAPDESLVYSYGNLFGLFPTNHFHNAIHVLIGVWGIAAFTSLSGSIVYNRIFAVLYILIGVMGLIPYANTMFGTMPVFGNNVWLNLLTAGLAFNYGFLKAPSLEATPGAVNATTNSL